MIEILMGKIQRPFLAQFLPALLLGVCCNQSRELWWVNRGMIITQIGNIRDQKIVVAAWDALCDSTT
jgi:hypothetical protein